VKASANGPTMMLCCKLKEKERTKTKTDRNKARKKEKGENESTHIYSCILKSFS
jgi:hypothetical protein